MDEQTKQRRLAEIEKLQEACHNHPDVLEELAKADRDFIEQYKGTKGTNNCIRIVVDTNDADYAEKLTPITTEQIEQFKPLIQAIKSFKEYTVKTDDGGKWTHWHNFPVGELYRKDLNEKRPEEMYVESGLVSQDCLDEFYEFIPRVDFHSIKTIEIVEVTSVNKLL